MPLTSFKCEAGIVPVKDCLKSCPKGDRCLSLATLHEIGKPKGYAGSKFSTTLLLQPTRIAFIQLTQDYHIEPKEQAYLLAGTYHHKRLEAVAKKVEGLKAELSIPDYEITSTLDNLEPDALNPDSFILWDYKFVGTYSIVKMINGDYNGYDWQLNHYRTQAERLGIKISRMFIQYTARDLTPRMAAEFKDTIKSKIDKLEIPKYPNDTVLEYFDVRREALQMALARNEMPEICDNRYSGDSKCKNYCSVNYLCPHGQRYLEAQALREATKSKKK